MCIRDRSSFVRNVFPEYFVKTYIRTFGNGPADV